MSRRTAIPGLTLTALLLAAGAARAESGIVPASSMPGMSSGTPASGGAPS